MIIASGAKPLKNSAALEMYSGFSEKTDASVSPQKKVTIATGIPIMTPMTIPVRIAFFALASFPAPTFCATNEDMLWIIEAGMSITKPTILCDTP